MAYGKEVFGGRVEWTGRRSCESSMDRDLNPPVRSVEWINPP